MTRPGACIRSVATAVPPNRIHQDEVREAARAVFSDLPDIDRLTVLFDRSGVEWRHLAYPKSFYLEPRSFRERNDHYVQVAMSIGEEAIRTALGRAALEIEDVDLFIFTTTTGLATPSIDARLVERLGMRRDVRRMPLFGLGCAGGVGAMSIATDYLTAHPESVAVVLSVELCSLTWNLNGISKVNLVGIALFADGAGCAVMTGSNREPRGARVVSKKTELFENTEHLMGWEFSDQGFELVLSPTVPGFIAEALPPCARAFLSEQDLSTDDIDHFALHPGGRQVLEAYRRGLGLNREALEPTREALRLNGNLSSASVFFSLDKVWETNHPRTKETGLMAAMGPGFATELLLLEWQ